MLEQNVRKPSRILLKFIQGFLFKKTKPDVYFSQNYSINSLSDWRWKKSTSSAMCWSQLKSTLGGRMLLHRPTFSES